MVILPLPARREFVTSETSIRGLHCAEVSYPAGMTIEPHVHDHASVTVIAEGVADEIGPTGSATTCQRGLVVVRPRREPHANRVGNGGVIHVEVDLAPQVLSDHRTQIARGSFSAPAPAARLAAKLRAALRGAGTLRALFVESIALELVAVALDEPRHASAAIERAYDRIRDEYREKLTIAELAREAGMHPVSFARAFRARYQVSPAEFVRELRAAWAADQLRARPDAAIAEIATEAGFYDQSHLARALVARFGCSPARLRTRLRSQRQD